MAFPSLVTIVTFFAPAVGTSGVMQVTFVLDTTLMLVQVSPVSFAPLLFRSMYTSVVLARSVPTMSMTVPPVVGPVAFVVVPVRYTFFICTTGGTKLDTTVKLKLFW